MRVGPRGCAAEQQLHRHCHRATQSVGPGSHIIWAPDPGLEPNDDARPAHRAHIARDRQNHPTRRPPPTPDRRVPSPSRDGLRQLCVHARIWLGAPRRASLCRRPPRRRAPRRRRPPCRRGARAPRRAARRRGGQAAARHRGERPQHEGAQGHPGDHGHPAAPVRRRGWRRRRWDRAARIGRSINRSIRGPICTSRFRRIVCRRRRADASSPLHTPLLPPPPPATPSSSSTASSSGRRASTRSATSA